MITWEGREDPPNKQSWELQESGQSETTGPDETENLMAPRDEPYLSVGASISSASCSYFLPLSMLPHSYPHICSWSCRLILSLLNPLWKVRNDKWTISSDAESEGGFFIETTLFCFPSNRQKQGRQNMDWTHDLAVHSLVQGGSPIFCR